MNSIFLGIAGPSCSGKTTLINKLEEKLGKDNVGTIHLDDYWNKDFETPIINGYKNRELPENLKLDDLFRDLSKLKKGEEVEVPFNLFQVENGKKIIRQTKIVIVEGFLLFYKKEIRDMFDFKVFLGLSDEEIVKRRIKRNRSGKNREEYYRTILIEEYRKHGLPAMNQADLVLDGINSVEENVDKIIGLLRIH